MKIIIGSTVQHTQREATWGTLNLIILSCSYIKTHICKNENIDLFFSFLYCWPWYFKGDILLVCILKTNAF